jgi:hypothetical protein
LSLLCGWPDIGTKPTGLPQRIVVYESCNELGYKEDDPIKLLKSQNLFVSAHKTPSKNNK